VSIRNPLLRGILAVIVGLGLVLQGTIGVLAGTTGAITGTVVDVSNNSHPIAGARVTAASPSQTVSTTTDAGGHYTFASLAPDTYTLTVAATSQYDTFSLSGVTVQADQSLTVALQQSEHLKQIGAVTSRSAASLVKPGTTADVYAINSTQQSKAAVLGGGGTLNSAWSAISSVPGVYVAPGQAGYIGAGDGVSIRGGDYDQIGYELDGVPVNRSFDNYPSSQLSSLGQQEVQVYTGAEPASGESEGLSGYINQVIRTGTLPASKDLDLSIGSPSGYGRLAFEAGGANPSRTFSYYLGLGAYNQDYRYADQFNGASLSYFYGTPLAPCPIPVPAGVPSCSSPQGLPYSNGTNAVTGGPNTPSFALGPYNYGDLNQVQDRDTIVNLHFGIPRADGNKDDVQVLYDNSHLNNIYYNSENDAGGAALLSSLGLATTYDDSYMFTGYPLGTVLPQTYTGGGTTPYLAPGTPSGRAFNAEIPPNVDDAFVNDQSIFKLQYQHNFGTSAFLRIYGYTDYSDWLNQGPLDDNTDYIGPVSPDYELNSHGRGVSLMFSDQLSSQHLLTFDTNYTTASSLRNNNFYYINGVNALGTLPDDVVAGLPPNLSQLPVVGVLVNGSAPYSGVCYSPKGVATPCYVPNPSGAYGVGLNLYSTTNPTGVGFFTLNDAESGTVMPAAGTCGTGPCEYLVAQNGAFNEYNTVKPNFMAASLTDNWQPNTKVTVNFGVRFDSFQFVGGNTYNSIARTFWYNAYNAQFPDAPLDNVVQQTETYTEIQPRLGVTYTLDPNSVLRASYGRYAEAPITAYEQYDFTEPDAPIGFPAGLGQFAAYGVGNTPMHDVRPQVSNNYDLSFEHEFGRDLAIKISPFLRQTEDQIQEFFLNQQTSFVSGLNVGRQRSQGVELEVDKGDFARNGFAGKLAFTYTASYINYEEQEGSSGPFSVLTGINAAISQYNGFTKAGGGAPCYSVATATAAGVATPCGAGTVANPYYNAPEQPLLSLNTNFPTFSLFPAGVGSFTTPTYGAPFVTTLLVQYKHDKLAVVPALQFSGGQRYGGPIAADGIDPTSCLATTGLGPVTRSGIPQAPLYPYGAAGGDAYDAATCAQDVAIPNPQTGIFDGIGAFVNPSAMQLHMQISYDVTPRLTFVASLVNIYSTCFGGTKEPWNVAGACGYTEPIVGLASPIGNAYNAGEVVQPTLQTEYIPTFGNSANTMFPFQMYFEARLKV